MESAKKKVKRTYKKHNVINNLTFNTIEMDALSDYGKKSGIIHMKRVAEHFVRERLKEEGYKL